MSGTLVHIADRVINRPLLIDPSKAEIIFAVLEGRITLSGGEAPSPSGNRFIGSNARPGRPPGLTRTSGRTALITIDGSLVNRGAWIGAYSGLTSYEGISAQLAEAVADKGIDSIILDINSPGGEVGGCFALAAAILCARRSKRVVAVVDDMAASAAYALGSAADEIIVSPTSIVGSIGVVLLHIDHSAALEKSGIKPTLIHAGAHKVDGNPFGPLPKDVHADLQANVDTLYRQFLAVVANGRGQRLSADAARRTEARTFIGQEAVSRGLADRIGSLDQVLAELNRPPAKPAATTKKETKMDASYDGAVARRERERIAAILNSPAAHGRMATAIQLATGSDMTAEEAISLLASVPAGSAAPASPGAAPRQEIGGGNPAAAASSDEVRAAWKQAMAGVADRVRV
jgi:signal peptide peptidase SppA